MTRTAAILGMALGLSAFLHFGLALLRDVAPVPVGGAATAILVGVTAMRTWRRDRRAQVGMILATLPLLTRFLAVYFETYRFWPGLPLIALATFTFGVGILGLLLDRFHPPEPRMGNPL